jgi:hypothetical protein
MSYIGSTPTTQSFIAGTDSFNGTGSATNFTLSRFVNSTNDIQVVVNNVVQYPPNYSVSGTTLTISPAPSAGTNNVYVRYLSTTLQSIAPSQGIGIQFGIGSLALPSISFIGDPNTGIYSPAADTIAFVEGGVEAMRIDSSANVGIGTSTNLTAKLNFDTTDRGETINIYTSSSDASRSGIGKYTSETRSYAGTSDFFAWRTGGPSGTERMRINSSGNFLVGTTSTTFSSTNYGLCFTPNAASFITVDTAAPNLNLSRNNNGDIFAFYRAGSQRGWISVETTGTTYGNLSDRRVKENFADSPSALSTIDQVKVTSFDWKEGGHTTYGFVAQDLNSVLPFAVTVGDDSDVIEKPWGIDNTKIVPYLTKAIQEQQAMIDTMKQEIAELKAKVGE